MGRKNEGPLEPTPASNTVTGVHCELENAIATAAATAALDETDPAEPPDEPDDKSDIVDRSVNAARTAASKGVGTAVAGGRATGAAIAGASRTVASAMSQAGSATAQSVGTGKQMATDATRRWAASVTAAAQGLLASDLSDSFNDLILAAVKGRATIYDKAMDAEYLATHIGGGAHRLFDGGHTISGAWRAARNAASDDTLTEEMLGAVQGLLRDVSTPRGLPLANWDKGTFDSVAESLQSSFGIPKSWFGDLVSYDAAELLGSTVGVVSVIFNWNKAESETFAQLAASMGLSATLSANPLLMLVSVVALARAFDKARSGDSYVDVADGAFKGALTSGASMGAVALVGAAGGPAGVAMLTGITAGVLAHTVTKDVELDAVYRFVKDEARTVMSQVAAQAVTVGGPVPSPPATGQDQAPPDPAARRWLVQSRSPATD